MRSSIVSAVVQGEQLPGPDRAWERTVALAGRAAGSGARLIAFPVTWLPGYPAWRDGRGDASGVRAVDTPAGRVGGLICWEHWMPLARQAMHESGEDVHVAAWPAVKEMNHVASRQYAFEGRCFVLAAGSVMRAGALPHDL